MAVYLLFTYFMEVRPPPATEESAQGVGGSWAERVGCGGGNGKLFFW